MWKATKDNNSDNVDYSSVKMLNNFHIGRPTHQLLYTDDPSNLNNFYIGRPTRQLLYTVDPSNLNNFYIGRPTRRLLYTVILSPECYSIKFIDITLYISYYVFMYSIV